MRTKSNSKKAIQTGQGTEETQETNKTTSCIL